MKQRQSDLFDRFLFFIPFILISTITAQDLPIDGKKIYQSAYETAMSDGIIDENEKAILTTLQNSLNLSVDEVAMIEIHLMEEKKSVLDQSGRWPLVAQNMFYAASMYGWMIPYVLEADNPKWYIGSEMMSLGASYYLTYKYTKQMNISHSRAQMMRAGSAVGLVYGRGINTFLGFDFDIFDEDSDGSKLGAWVLMASVPAGIYVGDKLYNRWQPSNGQAWSLTLWGEIGSWTMRTLHLILEEEPRRSHRLEYEYWNGQEWIIDEEAYERDREKYRRWKKTHVFFDMTGYPFGTYVAHRFFGGRQYTFGDAIMLMQGRSLGWLYAIMLGDIVDLDLEDPGARFLRMGGTIGGTLLFDKFIEGYDYTFGQSILTILGTASGMAFAGGIAAILEIEEFTFIEIMVMGGGVGGIYLANSILKLKPETKPTVNESEPTFSIMPSFQITKNLNGRSSYSIIPIVAMEIQL